MDMNIQSLQTSKADWRVDNDEPEMVHCMVFGLSSLCFASQWILPFYYAHVENFSSWREPRAAETSASSKGALFHVQSLMTQTAVKYTSCMS